MNKKNLLRLLAILLIFLLLTACGESEHGATDQPISRQRPQILDGDTERGKELIRQYGCGSCHQIPGIRAADGNVGPPLDNWADRQYIAGSLPNTPQNLIQWIRFPQAVEPGTVMPNLDIEEEEARDIAAYLYTLTDEGQFTDIFSTPRAAIGSLFSDPTEEGTPSESSSNGGEGQQQDEVPNTGQQSSEGSKSGAPQLVQQGEQVFSNNCAQCHGQDGSGQVGPALAGNNFVTSEDPAPVIQTVRQGRGQMPSFEGQLSNEQMAAVISYIRNAWGNNASVVSSSQIGSGQANQQGAQTGEPQDQSGQSQQQSTPTPGSQQGSQDSDQSGQQSSSQDQPGQQQGQTQQPEQADQTVQPPAAPQPQPGRQDIPAPTFVLVELYEWGIDISNRTIPAERVLFHVTNVGTRPHRFTIEGQGMELAFPEDIQVGQTRAIMINLQPGNYRIFCPQEDHAERGMNLEFTAAEIEEPALPRNQQESPTPEAATPTPTSQQQGDQNEGTQATPAPTQGEQNQSGGQTQSNPQSSDGQLTQQGEQVFSSSCAQCHGQNGEGQVGPALAGNDFVTSQDPSPIIDTVLHGRGQMPAFQGQLSNQQIAAVISFIRGSWGNNASTVSPDQVGGGQEDQSGDSTGNQNQQGGQTRQQGTQQTTTIELAAQNSAFDKNTITVPAGSSVTISMTNHDSIPHNFAVYQDSSARQAIFIGQTFTGPGQTVTYTFTAPAQPGSYFFRCDVHPFMNGTLTVK